VKLSASAPVPQDQVPGITPRLRRSCRYRSTDLDVDLIHQTVKPWCGALASSFAAVVARGRALGQTRSLKQGRASVAENPQTQSG
jgi:hypothetical protein